MVGKQIILAVTAIDRMKFIVSLIYNICESIMPVALWLQYCSICTLLYSHCDLLHIGIKVDGLFIVFEWFLVIWSYNPLHIIISITFITSYILYEVPPGVRWGGRRLKVIPWHVTRNRIMWKYDESLLLCSFDDRDEWIICAVPCSVVERCGH